MIKISNYTQGGGRRKYKENEVGTLLETRKKLKLMASTSKKDNEIEDIETKIVANTEKNIL